MEIWVSEWELWMFISKRVRQCWLIPLERVKCCSRCLFTWSRPSYTARYRNTKLRDKMRQIEKSEGSDLDFLVSMVTFYSLDLSFYQLYAVFRFLFPCCSLKWFSLLCYHMLSLPDLSCLSIAFFLPRFNFFQRYAVFCLLFPCCSLKLFLLVCYHVCSLPDLSCLCIAFFSLDLSFYFNFFCSSM